MYNVCGKEDIGALYIDIKQDLIQPRKISIVTVSVIWHQKFKLIATAV